MEKGLGWLENHTDVAAHRNRIDFVVNIHAMEVDLALEAKTANQVIHAVDAFQYRTLPQPEGPINPVILFLRIGPYCPELREKSPIKDLLSMAVYDHICLTRAESQPTIPVLLYVLLP